MVNDYSDAMTYEGQPDMKPSRPNVVNFSTNVTAMRHTTISKIFCSRHKVRRWSCHSRPTSEYCEKRNCSSRCRCQRSCIEYSVLRLTTTYFCKTDPPTESNKFQNFVCTALQHHVSPRLEPHEKPPKKGSATK